MPKKTSLTRPFQDGTAETGNRSKAMKRNWFLLSLIALAFPIALQAQEIHFAFTNNGDGTATVTGAYYTTYFQHAGGPFTIPSTYNGLPVTSIGSSFSGPWGLYFTSITIPATVTNIEAYAFEDDNNLSSIYFEGSPPVVGLYAFETHSQGNTTAYYLASMNGWGKDTNGFPTNAIFGEFERDGVSWQVWAPETGSVQALLSPPAAVAAGVRWSVDGGPPTNSGATLSNLMDGPHIVSFVPVVGWTAPADVSVTVKHSSIAKVSGKFTAWPPNTAPLTLQIIGNGTVTPNENGKLLQIGKQYTLTAVWTSASFFAGWTASGSESFSSTAAVLHFTMATNLVLQARFVPNPFSSIAGSYIGLFQGNGTNTLENSGYITLSVDTKGGVSGYWESGTTRHPFSGLLNTNFFYTNNIPVSGQGTISIGFSILNDGTVAGSLSGPHWSAAISAVHVAKNIIKQEGAGVYDIDFTAYGQSGSSGTGKAVMNFANPGPATLSGRLPDGTGFSASSDFSPDAPDANAPFYAPLYGGKGYLLGWMDFGPGNGGTDYLNFQAEGNFVWLQPNGSAIQLSASGNMIRSANPGAPIVTAR
jgi:hypothetical protein